MSNCYVCGCELTSDTRSVEHILLKAIGGRLRSSDLLCREHNSSLGKDIDAELASQLAFFTTMLNVNRDDNSTPPAIRGTQVSTGEKIDILPGGQPALAAPRFDKEDIGDVSRISISARDIREAKKILRGVQRKHPHIDINSILASAQPTSESVGQLHLSMGMGGPLAFRSICKTAVNFFIFCGGNPTCAASAIEYIEYGKNPSPVGLYYPPQEIVRKCKDDILHTVIVVGDSKERLLYSYIELFSAVQYLVILDWEHPSDFESTYCYDVLTSTKVERDWELHLSRSDAKGACQGQYDIIERIQTCFNTVYSIIDRKQRREHREKMISDLVDRFFERHRDEEYLTPAMIGEIADELASTLAPNMARQLHGVHSDTERESDPI